MLQKIYLSFKIVYLCLYYQDLLKKKEFRFFIQRHKTTQTQDLSSLVPFADRQMRRILKVFPTSSPCLLYCLVLSHLAGKEAQFYLWVQSKEPFQAHAYLKYQGQIYSTALGIELENSILLDDKSCLL